MPKVQNAPQKKYSSANVFVNKVSIDKLIQSDSLRVKYLSVGPQYLEAAMKKFLMMLSAFDCICSNADNCTVVKCCATLTNLQ